MKIEKIDGNYNQNLSYKAAKPSILSASEMKYFNIYKCIHDKSSKFITWNIIKKAVDVTHSLIGLIASFPIVLISAVAIKAESKGPIFFKQERLGKDAKPFTIYKLRTMYSDKAQRDFDIKNGDDSHITKVGKFLRKYSIDEFPQFWNILKGDMSLIGPRPITERTHNKRKMYSSKDYLCRYAVKPGASLSYKNTKCTNDKDTIAVEKDYVENWSLKKDFKTFLEIISKVINGKNY